MAETKNMPRSWKIDGKFFLKIYPCDVTTQKQKSAISNCRGIPNIKAQEKLGGLTPIFVINACNFNSTPGWIVNCATGCIGNPGAHANQFSWTKLILERTKCGQDRDALRIYKEMLEEGVIPSTYVIVAALKACGNLSDLEAGKEIHGHVIKSGNESHMFVATTLMNMYLKCWSTVDAYQVFEKMPHRDVVSWNAMIIGFVKMEKGDLALQIYARMQHEGVAPDDGTFVAALRACCDLAAYEQGKEVHGKLIKIRCLEKGRAIHYEAAKWGFESNILVANTLVDMYAKCGSMIDARQVFERMTYHTVVSWTSIIIGYARMEMGDSALQLYERMQNEGFTPNERTFVAALKACGSMAAHEDMKQVDGESIKIRCLEKGRIIHQQLLKNGFESNIFIANSLVDMYVKCGSMVDACKVFERMMHRTVVSWSAMIIGYAQMEMGEVALQLYARMQNEGFMPNDRTFVAALKACGSLAAHEEVKEVDGELVKIRGLEKGRALHSQVVNSGFESDTFLATALLVMYVKCGSMIDARKVFEKMRHRTVVSWNAMIIGYAQMEMEDSALQLYARMQQEGFTPDCHTFVAALKACSNLAAQEEAKKVGDELIKIKCLEKGRAIHCQVLKSVCESDVFVATALVVMYAKCGSMVNAGQVFEKMMHRTIVSWNAMIIGYAQLKKGDLALQLYARMQHEGVTPNAYSFVAALKACGCLACLETGKKIHTEICKARLDGETFVANCLIDMYSKCGSMVDAQQLFDSFPVKDVVTWSALIAGYSSQGDSERVFNLLERMQQENIQPDAITLVSVLTVCSHKGLVDKGQKYFQAMCSEYGIIPHSEHYSCIVDLLGRAGQLDEAVAVVKKMPFEPVIVAWMTILGACQKWNYVEMGKRAFECAVRLGTKCAAPYVLMTNIFDCPHVRGDSKLQLRKNA